MLRSVRSEGNNYGGHYHQHGYRGGYKGGDWHGGSYHDQVGHAYDSNIVFAADGSMDSNAIGYYAAPFDAPHNRKR